MRDSTKPNIESLIPLQNAEGVATGGTLNVTAAPLALEIEELSVNNSAFELDYSPELANPAFELTARVLARGQEVTSDLFAKYSIALPGHEGSVVTGVTPDFSYNAGRTIGLFFENEVQDANGEAAFELGDEQKYKRQCFSEEGCSPVSLPQGVGVSSMSRLHLGVAQTRLLGETLRYRSLNPDLTTDDEIAGTLKMEVYTYINGQKVSATKEIPVVFMAPPAPRDQLETDPTRRPSIATPTGATTLGPYHEVDEFTPTVYVGFGGEWLGAWGQLKNQGSKERKNGAVVKQRIDVDNYARAKALKQTKDYLVIQGHADWGSQRSLAQNSSSGLMKIDGTTLLSWTFDPTTCAVDPSNALIERCVILEAKPSDGNDNIEIKQDEDDGCYFKPLTYTVECAKQIDKELCIKGMPICVQGYLKIAASIGLEGAIALEADDTNPPERFTGISSSIGLTGKLDGEAFGGVSVFVARAGFEGTTSIIEAKLKPKLSIGIAQAENVEGECWWTNTGRVKFRGDASLKTLEGRVGVVGYVGIDKFGINLEKKVFDFKLVAWNAVYDKKWVLWDVAEDFLGGGGLCPGVPDPARVWNSPLGCETATGDSGYCSNAPYNRSTDQYLDHPRAYRGEFYLGQSGCGTLTVNGVTEANTDQLWVGGLAYVENTDGNYVSSLDWNTAAISDGSTCASDASGLELGNSLFGDGEPCQSPLSGRFVDTKIRVCHPSLRAVRFLLSTDQIGVRRGLTIKLDIDEGEESAIYSDTTWRSSIAPADPDNFDLDFGRLDYDGPDLHATVASIPLGEGFWGGSPPAGFDAEDAAKAKWMWPSPVGVLATVPVYYVRKFMAAKDSYDYAVVCDDLCDVFLDGTKIASTTQFNTPLTGTLTTKKGKLHVISIKTVNFFELSAANFMMK